MRAELQRNEAACRVGTAVLLLAPCGLRCGVVCTRFQLHSVAGPTSICCTQLLGHAQRFPCQGGRYLHPKYAFSYPKTTQMAFPANVGGQHRIPPQGSSATPAPIGRVPHTLAAGGLGGSVATPRGLGRLRARTPRGGSHPRPGRVWWTRVPARMDTPLSARGRGWVPLGVTADGLGGPVVTLRGLGRLRARTHLSARADPPVCARCSQGSPPPHTTDTPCTFCWTLRQNKR